MEYGIVLPHNEIGTDPGAMKAFAQGAEALGATHILIYDHVLGADPNRPGGWKNRPYDKDVAFHEPFTTFAFIAAVTSKIEMMSAVLILPQRQTALVAKQAAEVALLSNGRFRLGVGTGAGALGQGRQRRRRRGCQQRQRAGPADGLGTGTRQRGWRCPGRYRQSLQMRCRCPPRGARGCRS